MGGVCIHGTDIDREICEPCQKLRRESQYKPQEQPKLDNVKVFPGITKLDMDPDIILSKALEAGLKEVVIVGTRDDGELFFAGNLSSGPEVLWLLEEAKQRLMNMVLGK